MKTKTAAPSTKASRSNNLKNKKIKTKKHPRPKNI
jgi:hypothetical protein